MPTLFAPGQVYLSPSALSELWKEEQEKCTQLQEHLMEIIRGHGVRDDDAASHGYVMFGLVDGSTSTRRSCCLYYFRRCQDHHRSNQCSQSQLSTPLLIATTIIINNNIIIILFISYIIPILAIKLFSESSLSPSLPSSSSSSSSPSSSSSSSSSPSSSSSSPSPSSSSSSSACHDRIIPIIISLLSLPSPCHHLQCYI